MIVLYFSSESINALVKISCCSERALCSQSWRPKFPSRKAKANFYGRALFLSARAASYTAGHNHKDKNHRAALCAYIHLLQWQTHQDARVPNVCTINARRHTLLCSLRITRGAHSYHQCTNWCVIKAYCLLYGNNKKWAEARLWLKMVRGRQNKKAK